MQIRYADTQEQKSLKQQTQAARQFRSAEYEYATQAWRQGRIPFAGTTVNDNISVNGNEFEQYLGTSAAVPIQGQRWAHSAMTRGSGRNPLAATHYNNAMSQTPLVQINVASDSDGRAITPPSRVDGDSKQAVTSPATAHAKTPANPVNVSDKE